MRELVADWLDAIMDIPEIVITGKEVALLGQEDSEYSFVSYNTSVAPYKNGYHGSYRNSVPNGNLNLVKLNSIESQNIFFITSLHGKPGHSRRSSVLSDTKQLRKLVSILAK